MQVTNMGLQNELLASQIAKLRSSINPPLPVDPAAIPEGKLADRTALSASGEKLNNAPGWSDGSEFEDRWGEWGGSAAGLAVMAADLLNHARSRTTIERAPWSWWPKVTFKPRS